ncbi:MAG: FAD/NAD(P)-binding oxidoreductase [Alphaproteobacteria bacterium]|nr:FAD/NAD(P)-binding oxidoreductase [Alphaproteobacteria bacterium]
MADTADHDVLIIGGGTAGITVAASLRRRAPKDMSIGLVDPNETHCYQPALTLVGAGAYELEDTRRSEDGLIPPGVTWHKVGAQSFDPDHNTVHLTNGQNLSYRYLVVCTGIKLDLDKVDGLAATLGQNGVCTNYSPDYAPYTWDCLKTVEAGQKLVFTQPPMPFKCPGAPQKIAYLAADRLRQRGMLGDCDLDFYTATPAIFGVPYFARRLSKVAEEWGINVHTEHTLVAVDGPGRQATFEAKTAAGETESVTVPFDMLHVTPPQSPHDFIKSSPLANEAGYVEVDQNSLQHVRYPHVFALGDVASTANSKTAAAIRKQAPVVVRNILHMEKGGALDTSYDGYASCPLTVSLNRVILAEFIYGGKVTPTWPIRNPGKRSRLMWWVKKTGLPLLYWNYMLKGREAFFKHQTAWGKDDT